MITIITALRAEAEPFINSYHLKERKNAPFLSFYNDQIELIISGMNPYNAAIATTYILTIQNKKPRAVINFGICGSYHKDDAVGKAYQIKKIVDHSSQKVYHLQNKKKLLQTADITTFHTPQNNSQKNKIHLIDMESRQSFVCVKHIIPLMQPDKYAYWWISKNFPD